MNARIAAEVIPIANRSTEAALALQRLGFRVRHVGATSVSVEAEEDLWSKVFGVRFEDATIERAAGIPGATASFRRAIEDAAKVPDSLRNDVESISFEEPPQLF